MIIVDEHGSIPNKDPDGHENKMEGGSDSTRVEVGSVRER